VSQFCLRCGEENTFGTAFCKKCGAATGVGSAGDSETVAAATSLFFPGAGFAYVGAIAPALALSLVWWMLPCISNVIAAIYAHQLATAARAEGRSPRFGLAVGAALLSLKVGAVGLLVLVPLLCAAVGLSIVPWLP